MRDVAYYAEQHRHCISTISSMGQPTERFLTDRDAGFIYVPTITMGVSMEFISTRNLILSSRSYVRKSGRKFMETEMHSSAHMEKVTCEIRMKLPSLNDYIRICRANKYESAKFKRDIEFNIGWYICRLPVFENPVKIHFHWIEENKRRDLDNICFAKKFILDALVKNGKLKDDNRKCVTAFTDSFSYGKEAKVILEIEEAQNDDKNT